MHPTIIFSRFSLSFLLHHHLQYLHPCTSTIEAPPPTFPPLQNWCCSLCCGIALHPPVNPLLQELILYLLNASSPPVPPPMFVWVISNMATEILFYFSVSTIWGRLSFWILTTLGTKLPHLYKTISLLLTSICLSLSLSSPPLPPSATKVIVCVILRDVRSKWWRGRGRSRGK